MNRTPPTGILAEAGISTPSSPRASSASGINPSPQHLSTAFVGATPSKTATLSPFLRRAIAPARPAGPPPAIATSVFTIVIGPTPNRIRGPWPPEARTFPHPVSAVREILRGRTAPTTMTDYRPAAGNPRTHRAHPRANRARFPSPSESPVRPYASPMRRYRRASNHDRQEIDRYRPPGAGTPCSELLSRGRCETLVRRYPNP